MGLSDLAAKWKAMRARRKAEKEIAKKARDAKWQKALEAHRKAEEAKKAAVQSPAAVTAPSVAPSGASSAQSPNAGVVAGEPAVAPEVAAASLAGSAAVPQVPSSSPAPSRAELLARIKAKQQPQSTKGSSKTQGADIMKALKARQAAAQARKVAEADAMAVVPPAVGLPPASAAGAAPVADIGTTQVEGVQVVPATQPSVPSSGPSQPVAAPVAVESAVQKATAIDDANRRAAEEKARQDKEAADRRAAEEKARQEKEAADRRAAEEKARQEKEAADRRAAEEKARQEKEAAELAAQAAREAAIAAAAEKERQERVLAEKARVETAERVERERVEQEKLTPAVAEEDQPLARATAAPKKMIVVKPPAVVRPPVGPATQPPPVVPRQPGAPAPSDKAPVVGIPGKQPNTIRIVKPEPQTPTQARKTGSVSPTSMQRALNPPSTLLSGEFRFSCPYCGQKMKALENLIGKLVTCTECRRLSPVPRPSRESGVGVAEQPLVISLQSPGGSTPVPPQMFKFFCPACGQKLSAKSEWVGRQVRCPACEVSSTIPPPKQ